MQNESADGPACTLPTYIINGYFRIDTLDREVSDWAPWMYRLIWTTTAHILQEGPFHVLVFISVGISVSGRFVIVFSAN